MTILKKNWNNLLRFLGHHYNWIVGALFAYVIIVAFLFKNARGFDGWMLTVPILLCLPILFHADTWHEYNLCVRCFDEFPLMPQDEAEKHRRSLRMDHWTDDHRYLAIGFLLALMAGNLVAADMSFWGTQGLVLVTGTVLFTVRRWERMHDKYEPWCPYCGPGGGEETEQLQPQPDPEMSR